MTPKQLQKKIEAENRLKDKQKAKEERDKKLQEEKDLRQKEREEKERQRKKEREDKEELKRKEREEKEEQRRKEKEDRDRKKQIEIDARNEDRRKKEEEKTAKEEAEVKKKEAIKQAFTKFFVPAKGTNKKLENVIAENDEPEIQCNFMPFCIKEGMKMAPLVRSTFTDERKTAMENIIFESKKELNKTDLYLEQLNKPDMVPGKYGRTWPNDELDCQIIGKLVQLL